MIELREILRRNFLTPVVISVYTLVILLLVVREFRDAIFISVVITINTMFAVIQEIRARRALRKLELMNAPQARLYQPDGSVSLVPYTSIDIGDMVEIVPGDEIPADGEVVESRGLEVNESMLTGESVSVEKEIGSPVYAASAVTAGSATVRITAVGANTRTGMMTASLRRYTPQLTPLQQRINKLITMLTWGALVLAIIITVTYWFDGYTARDILKTITSAGITIIPEGLILASTILLAFGSLKLAQAKVLPQKLSAIEGMALMDLLCVDKTGTLTSDEIKFDELKVWDKRYKSNGEKVIGAAVHALGGGNSTADALVRALPVCADMEVQDVLAFSSTRKLSGVRFTCDSATHTVILGAPEYVSSLAAPTAAQQAFIDEHTDSGKRVLLVVSFTDDKTPLKKLSASTGQVLGCIVLSNELRVGVQDTVNYLQSQGVSIRVISGDNPRTVQYVAASAGIADADRVITGAELAQVKRKDWDATVLGTTIFARVLPEQKEALIQTFKSHGKYTGMAGDGVNDALALKESDLGVAMFAGAAASRRVADLVLLNNSFTSLPMGMKLGNRIMQAIEIISILFFHKIIYGVTLLMLTIIIGLPYPFDPRHNTFMNIFMVTLPTLMWTLFPPLPQHRINPNNFWRDTVRAIAPIAVLSGIAVFVTYYICSVELAMETGSAATITVVVATIFGLNTVFLAERMMAAKITRVAMIAQAGLFGISLGIMWAAFGFNATRRFFDFDHLAFKHVPELWPMAMVIVGTLVVQHVIAYRARKRLMLEITE